jgi:1-acyl-sn-glycerol-3-phosphate acyltransferase
VIDGAYADILWAQVDRDRTRDADAAWREHVDRAVSDFRRIAEVVRRGDQLVIFPEGDNSLDGRIGPIRPGLGSLVRRGSVRLIQPVAIAFDPLGGSRRRAYVAVGPALDVGSTGPPAGGGEQRARGDCCAAG